MGVSPEDIRAVQFRERLRGYNPDDVDRFVERVADAVQLLQQQLRRAVDRAERAEAKAGRDHSVGPGAGHTLQLAQRAAELVLHDAEAEASRLVSEAEERARTMVSDAERRAIRMDEEARSRLQLDVRRLELARERLSEEVTALDRYLEEARSRAQRCLTEAALGLEAAVPAFSTPSPANVSNGEPVEGAPPSSLGDMSEMSHHVVTTPSLAEAD